MVEMKHDRGGMYPIAPAYRIHDSVTYAWVQPDPFWMPDKVCLHCVLSLPCFTECWGVRAFTTKAFFFGYGNSDPIVARMNDAGDVRCLAIPVTCQKYRAADAAKNQYF